MALSEHARNKMYNYFSTTELGKEATGEMMSYFPARDVEEPVTKADLHQEVALLRVELHEELANLRAELRAEIADAKDELRAEIATTKEDLRAEIATTKDELRAEMSDMKEVLRAEFRSEIRGLGDSVRGDTRQLLFWLISTQFATLAIVVALITGMR